MKMKLGLSTASYFQKIMIEDAVLDIGAHGVQTCELFLNTFSEYEPDFIAMLADRVQMAGMSVYSVHPMSTQFEPQLFSVHSRQRIDAWSLYERILRGARKLGAQVYVMHGPVHLAGAAKNIQLARIAPIFRDLSDMAASYGVTLALENVSWCAFNSPAFGRALRETLGPGSLKYTLDIKQAVRSGHDPLDFIEAVGPDIVNLHLCDAAPGGDGGTCLRMPGFGVCDFQGLYDALQRQGADYAAFIEVYSDMYEDVAALYESYLSMRAIFCR
ncbi:MAG: sugar phosphate isomerase/epimerase [Clostridia bacterium]|nr:sugar phosphate isomerase/epimerase [Clostridia bacterium]